jgi:hypothetical protein
VLTQYKSHSLDTPPRQDVADVAAARQLRRARARPDAHRAAWFAGSADAIYQNLNIIRDEKPDYICVFGADNLYRMDASQMVDQHIETGRGRDRRGPPGPDRAGLAVRGHRDGRGRPHPRLPREAERRGRPADDPTQVFASMGNYVFTTEALIDGAPRDAEDDEPSHDMGGDIITGMVDAATRPSTTSSATTTCPAPPTATGVLARRRDDRRLLRRAHGPDLGPPDLQPLQPRLADLHLARPAPAGEVRVRRGRPARDRRSTRWCAPVWSSPAAAVRGRSSPPASRSTPSPRSRLGAAARGRHRVAARSSATPSSTRTS